MTEYLKREDVRRAVLHNEGDAVIAAIDALPVIVLPDELHFDVNTPSIVSPDEFCPQIRMREVSFTSGYDEKDKAFIEAERKLFELAERLQQ